MTPKHFKTQELVSPAVYNKRGQKALELIDSRLIETLDTLRENLNKPITINSWIWGGDRTQSGLRDKDFYKTEYDYINSLSQHKYGRAADFLVKGMTAPEVRKHIINNLDLYPYIKFIECDISWTHIDVRNRSDLACWSPERGFVSAYDMVKLCL